MALTDSNEHSDKKSADSHKSVDKKEKLLTKVIIRRLPPHMDQETFLNQISPVPPYDYFYMVKGDASLGENSFSRAYINFTNPNDIYDFKEKFDNYVFLDNAGHEYPAVVEFAAFQKIPKRRNKVRVDPKVGTIESDQYYQEFLEMINKPPEQDEKPEYTYQITSDNNNKNNSITPLLEYIKNKRAEKMRIREERREERKRKEFERKKFREDERKKRFEEKSPVKTNKGQYTKVVSPKENKNVEKDNDKPDTNEIKGVDEKPEKDDTEVKPEKLPTSYYKSREKKYEDKKKDPKPKYIPKKDYVDKREYKSRRDDYKDRDYRVKSDDYKKEDPKSYQKKVKKYSEKREERKMEAQKAEQKKLEQQQQESSAKTEKSPKLPITEEKQQSGPNQKEEERSSNDNNTIERDMNAKTSEKESKITGDGQSQTQSQRRIRNKDRPTIAIYRPGMLSKRKQTDGESENKESKKD